MIVLTLQQALLLYSTIIVVGMIAAWLWTELGGRRRRRELEAQNLWRCVYCGFLYLDESGEKLSTCPQCGNINTAEDRKAREVPLSGGVPKTTAPAEPSEKPRRNPSKGKGRGR